MIVAVMGRWEVFSCLVLLFESVLLEHRRIHRRRVRDG